MKYVETEITIGNRYKTQVIMAADGVKLKREREGAPSTLTFTVHKDNTLSFDDGNTVCLYVDGVGVFKGYVFKKSRSISTGTIDVTCYDQIRYLKNDLSRIYDGKTLSQIVNYIADDLKMEKGLIELTGYKVNSDGAPIVFNSVPAIDIIDTCIEQTRRDEDKLYVLYDDFGKLCLQNVSNMVLDIYMDAETVQETKTATSIDENTYNQIRLKYSSGSDTALDGVHIVNAPYDPVKDWGTLSKTIDVDTSDTVALEALGKTYLAILNNFTRTLSVEGAEGDIRVRGGSGVPCRFVADDILNRVYVVKNVTHKFENGCHWMDFNLEGGDIFE